MRKRYDFSKGRRNPYARRLNPLSVFPGGGTSVSSDRRWATLARKGHDLLMRNGIHLAGEGEKIAAVEVDSAKPNTVIGAVAVYTKSVRNGTITMAFDLAVDERYRGRGTGRQLIDAALNIIAAHARFTLEPRVVAEIEVVNDIVLEALRRRGFIIRHTVVNGWTATKVIK